MENGKITTVVFDLGGVLVKFDPRSGLQKMGFTKEAEAVFMDKIFSGLWEACDAYQMDLEEVKALFKKHVPGYEKEVDLLWEKLPMVTGVYDYSRAWVQSLKDAGYKVYVLSNFGQASFEINSQVYDFLELMDGQVISYEIEKVKPEPQIYEVLMERYGIRPKEAVFIDDRKINADGARAVGMQAIVFENHEQAVCALREMGVLG